MSGVLEQLVADIELMKLELAELRRPRPTWITVADYAATRSIAESTVRSAVANGRLPSMKYGDTSRAIRVRADVEIGEPLRPKRSEVPDADANPAAWSRHVRSRLQAKGARK